jgi:hypothetical protein
MYYERLKNIYKSNDLNDLYPEISITEFDLFIRNQIKGNNKYVNPYKFSYEQNVSINTVVKFFIYFTGDDGLFDLITYFECSSPSCVDTRIFIDMDDPDEIISCEECGKRYKLATLQKYIKVLFKIKMTISIPDPIKRIERKDPNSTFEALKELPPSLKIESPSSLDERNQFIDEGDESNVAVDLPLVFNENDNKGEPISPAIERFKRNLLALEEE